MITSQKEVNNILERVADGHNKQCALKKIVPETAKRRRRTYIDHGTFRRKCGIRELRG